MKRADVEHLLDRAVAAAQAQGKPTAIVSDGGIEPGHMLVAIHCPLGTCVIAVPASDWDAVKAAKALGFQVPTSLAKLAADYRAGKYAHEKGRP